MKHFLILTLALLCITCKQNSKEVSNPDGLTAAVKSLEIYGDTVREEGAISVNDAIASLKTNDSIMCSVNGFVTGVCQAKGCWMMISNAPTDSTGLFVKFKDYGFFVPKDLAGSRIVIGGKAFKQVTSVDELRHYAEDEGKPKAEIEAITSPVEEMKFMADGVLVLDRNK